MLSLEIVLTPQTIAFALLIFSLRVFNYAISTIRLVFVGRGMRVWSAGIAFVEAFIFAVVIANVVSEINDALNLFAYCLGAAGGSYVGMWLESRLITSYSTVTVIASEKGEGIAEHLRSNGYGVTVTIGQGRDGDVTVVRSTINNREMRRFIHNVESINEHAFIEIEQSRTLQRGWVPGGPRRRL